MVVLRRVLQTLSVVLQFDQWKQRNMITNVYLPNQSWYLKHGRMLSGVEREQSQCNDDVVKSQVEVRTVSDVQQITAS